MRKLLLRRTNPPSGLDPLISFHSSCRKCFFSPHLKCYHWSLHLPSHPHPYVKNRICSAASADRNAPLPSAFVSAELSGGECKTLSRTMRTIVLGKAFWGMELDQNTAKKCHRSFFCLFLFTPWLFPQDCMNIL